MRTLQGARMWLWRKGLGEQAAGCRCCKFQVANSKTLLSGKNIDVCRSARKLYSRSGSVIVRQIM